MSEPHPTGLAADVVEAGPMNLGPKDELLLVKRDTLESLLVAVEMNQHPARHPHEADRLRRILREGGDAPDTPGVELEPCHELKRAGAALAALVRTIPTYNPRWLNALKAWDEAASRVDTPEQIAARAAHGS